jgi:hypothetical protein
MAVVDALDNGMPTAFNRSIRSKAVAKVEHEHRKRESEAQDQLLDF